MDTVTGYPGCATAQRIQSSRPYRKLDYITSYVPFDAANKRREEQTHKLHQGRPRIQTHAVKIPLWLDGANVSAPVRDFYNDCYLQPYR